MGLEVWKALDFGLLGEPLSPLGSIGWDWTAMKNLNTASCLLRAIAVVFYGESAMRGANGGQFQFVQCW